MFYVCKSYPGGPVILNPIPGRPLTPGKPGSPLSPGKPSGKPSNDSK